MGNIVAPPSPAKKPQLVAVIVRRGQHVLCERLAPQLVVVREPGKPARVVVAST